MITRKERVWAYLALRWRGNKMDIYTMQCAERGAKLLDEKLPGWATQIDLDTLDLWSPKTCILGQLYADFEVGLQVTDTDGNAVKHGFVPGIGIRERDLRHAWQFEITKRVIS